MLLRSFLPDSDQKTSSKNAIAYIINCFFAKFPPSMFYEKRKISVIYLESFHLVCSVKVWERGIGDSLIVICGKTTPPPYKPQNFSYFLRFLVGGGEWAGYRDLGKSEKPFRNANFHISVTELGIRGSP